VFSSSKYNVRINLQMDMLFLLSLQQWDLTAKTLGHYEVRGFLTIDTDPFMTVIPSPWVVTLNTPFQEKPLIKNEPTLRYYGSQKVLYTKIEADIPSDIYNEKGW